MKRLLPSMSPDPAEMQRAIEVQLIRSAVASMTKNAKQPEQRASANQEWVSRSSVLSTAVAWFEGALGPSRSPDWTGV